MIKKGGIMKQNLITEEKVFEELKKAIVETLRVDEGSIKPESSLINDLGAESLDFLDVNYRLEQAFGIKMARHFVLERNQHLTGGGFFTLNDVFEVFLDQGAEFAIGFMGTSIQTGQGIQVFTFAFGHFPNQRRIIDLGKHFALFFQFDQSLWIAIGKTSRNS